MKQLANLDLKIEYPDKNDPDMEPSAIEAESKLMPPYRRLLRFVCMNPKAKDVSEADNCDQARMKLSQAQPDVILEDAEFKAVFERVKENPLGWSSYIHSAMLRYMREAEARKVDIKLEVKEA